MILFYALQLAVCYIENRSTVHPLRWFLFSLISYA